MHVVQIDLRRSDVLGRGTTHSPPLFLISLLDSLALRRTLVHLVSSHSLLFSWPFRSPSLLFCPSLQARHLRQSARMLLLQ
jgi:hypothetical protein